ncbi:hypothetical protein MSAN_01116500 [Mycena sanguinolenta]|uniref:Uncharacterized protein n=1 Tax=Mycena sanguinolenta TaxID=230812 RepID=A0A8H6YKU8_9AGAR|nr:hypothetical protein MSAN_01116500 [Mycena sanguinolenta]
MLHAASPCDAMWGGHGRGRGREGGRGYEGARETGGLFCALVASCVVAEVRKAACVLHRRAGILAAVAAGAGHLIGKTDAMGSKIGTGGRSLNSVDASPSHPRNESRLRLCPRPAVPYPSRVAAAAVAVALASTNESEHRPPLPAVIGARSTCRPTSFAARPCPSRIIARLSSLPRILVLLSCPLLVSPHPVVIVPAWLIDDAAPASISISGNGTRRRRRRGWETA